MGAVRALFLTLVLLSCAPARSPDVALVLHESAEADAIALALKGLDAARFEVKASKDPVRELGSSTGLAIAVTTEASLCAECFRVERDGARVTLTAGGSLGLQYGLAHWLESLGYGFFHPHHTREPAHFPSESDLVTGDFSPEIARRGLHLHTLHPIEALFDFWMPSDDHLEGAKRTIDWIIRNRGNTVQWAALDELIRNPSSVPAWRAHTKAIIDYAHSRGVTVGLTVQLFDKASLQQSFTLVDGARPDDENVMRERIALITNSLGLDNLNLSFGEFFGAEPQLLVDRIDATYRVLQEVAPDTKMSAVIHVGDTPELRVDYAGRRQLYYFLVRYANPAVFPRVHTVMFYNLFDSAGGAYEHTDFSEHREFIRERLQAGQPVGYYPEAAYWVAFDNAVPLYLPVYLRSRHQDLAGVRAMNAGALSEHLVFSSGWEWGYWQNDALSLRMSYRLPTRWEEGVTELFRSLPEGASASSIATRLGEAQHRALIVEELAAYLAGRDQVLDAAFQLGHVAAPDRPSFASLDASFTPTLAKLKAHADEVEVLAQEASSLAGKDPFLDELVDGVEMSAARARFSWAVFAAAQAFNTGAPHQEALDVAKAELVKAQRIAGRRRLAFHAPNSQQLISDGPNPSFYDYGYLRDANTLCFWRRELAQVRNLAEQAGVAVPGCVL